MIDFHSHILSGMDDGAKTSAISIQMLTNSYAQGIDRVVHLIIVISLIRLVSACL